jgi:drug/metabolite transporter (DMT)-like permease
VRRSSLVLVAVCSFWGTIPLLARQVDLPAPAIVSVRVWVAAAGLGLAVLLAGRRPDGGRRTHPALFAHRPGRCLVAGALLAVHWTAMFAGYRRADADIVVLVVFLAPVGVAALAPRLLGERLDGRTIAALAVALAGFVLIAAPHLGDAGTTTAGIAFAALSAATFVALILVSKPLAEVYGGLRLTFIEMLVAGVALVPAAVTTNWHGADATGWVCLVVLGTFHTAVAISLYLGALAEVPATHAGILGYLEPASVVLLSWLFLDQVPRLATLAGGLLVVAAGTVVVLGAAVPTPEVPTRVPG